MRRRLLFVTTAALAAVSMACSGQPTASPRVHASRSMEYQSLRHAARDAVAVVEIAVERSGVVETVGSVPFTVTEAQVTDVVKGRYDGATVRLRQLGSTEGTGLLPEGELLQAGKRYVALVVPFTFGDVEPTGQHVVVGGWQGLYRVDGDMLVATDAARTALPRRLTRSSFVAAVTS